MINVVVDDERTFPLFPDDTVYLRTSSEALDYLARHMVNFQLRYAEPFTLYLDHDLGENDDIRVVVDFLYVIGVRAGVEEVLIHSQNPVSADLVKVLKSAGIPAAKIALPESTVA